MTASDASTSASDRRPDAPEHPPPASSKPQYGPRGYLPERAAKRARKVVLREEMGLQWPLAAGIAALLVLVGGGLFLWTQTGPPGPPYAAVGAISEVDPRGLATSTVGDLEVLVVRAGGGVRVFAGDIDDVALCATSRRLQGPDGTVYSPTGRALGGGTSLQPVPSTVHDGVLYVSTDPTTWPEAPPATTDADPSC